MIFTPFHDLKENIFNENIFNGLFFDEGIPNMGGRQFVKTVTRQNCNSSKRIRQNCNSSNILGNSSKKFDELQF